MAKVGVLNALPQVNLPFVQSKVCAGEMFRTVLFYQGITDGEIKRLLFVTGDRAVHTFCQFSMEGPMYITFCENPVVATSGTSVSGYNLNRSSPNTPKALMYKDATFSSTGTTLVNRYVVGQTAGGTGVSRVLLSMSEVSPGSEVILDTATLYTMMFTNAAKSNQSMNIMFDFFEEK